MPDIPRSHLIAYGLALLAVVGFGVRQVAHSRAGNAPAGVPLETSQASATGAEASDGKGSAPTGAARKLVVHVAGAVRRPGVYRFEDGLRVDDAVRRAGGAAKGADLSQLNLAAELEDGRQVLVPLGAGAMTGGDARGVAGGAVAGGGASAGGGAAGGAAAGGATPGRATAGGAAPGVAGGTGAIAAAPVNLNTATLEQLDTLAGVGPVTAQKILVYRQEHNGFGSIDELGQIPGIGPKRLATLRELVTL